MLKKIIINLLIAGFLGSGLNAENNSSGHQLWDKLLKRHVSPQGWVDYAGFKMDEEILAVYLENLEKTKPDELSRLEALAFWINAYNAFTVQLILDHYPVESIRDIGGLIQIPFVNSPWDIKFITIDGENYDLNNIEHGILRKKFEDPRIHFAIVCASYSCPRLRNEAYFPDRVEDQLKEDTYKFINDPTRNQLNPKVKLSKIFSWYKGDFTKEGSLIDFVNKYAETPVEKKSDFSYLNYDWRLNEQKAE